MAASEMDMNTAVFYGELHTVNSLSAGNKRVSFNMQEGQTIEWAVLGAMNEAGAYVKVTVEVEATDEAQEVRSR